MRIGRIVGNVVTTIKDAEHYGKKLMLVRFLDCNEQETEEEFLYADAACAGVGDLVLVSEDGSAAETELQLESGVCTFDGVILGVVDYYSYDKDIAPVVYELEK